MVQVEPQFLVQDTQTKLLQRLQQVENVSDPSYHHTNTNNTDGKVNNVHDADNTQHEMETHEQEDEVTKVLIDERDGDTDDERDNKHRTTTTAAKHERRQQQQQKQQHIDDGDARSINATAAKFDDNEDKLLVTEGELLITHQEKYATRRMGSRNNSIREEIVTSDGDDGGDRRNVVDDCCDDDDDDDGTPDGGWGYVVVLGTFVIVNSVGITSACFGILFLNFLKQMGTSSTMIASIYNSEAFLWSCANLIGGPLTDVLGWRWVAMVGSILMALGIVLSAFATSANFLFFSHSILTGLGSGLCCLVAFAIIPFYFKRRRGLANGLMMAGMCTGGMFWPSIITHLQDEYGYKGATLILAGVMLNNCVAASVFHPVAWHRRKPNKNKTQAETKVLLSSSVASNRDSYGSVCEGSVSETCKDKQQGNGDNVLCHADINKDIIDDTLYASFLGEENDAEEVKLTQKCKATENHHQNNNYNSSNQRNAANTHTTQHHETKSRQRNTGNNTQSTQQNEKKNKQQRLADGIKAVFVNLAVNIKVLKSPTAVIVSIGVAGFVGVYLNFVMITPFAMDAMGYTQEEISWSLALSNVCNLVSRLVVSPLSDFPNFNITKMFMAGTATLAFAAVGFCLVDGLVMMSVMLGVWGVGVGTCNCLYTLLLVQCLGLDKFKAMLGVSGVLSGVWMLASGPLYGVVRDLSGSYTVTICTMVSTALLTIVLFLFIPAAMRYDKRKARQEELEEEDRRRKEELC
ncbi:hypothetical protein Pcinc_008962 [Petrolisthes cinctipes]|uniref:Uncharacterized protein n=1 Tax=Petrolisthes cinctipes TaxID=88211 RepID=A0AAE1G891_PETCI|nr:hypothetical protein Pcinc_008962 [Petrolisthes cinctipes]